MGSSYTKYSISESKSSSISKQSNKYDGDFRRVQSRAASISHASSSPYPDFITKLSEILETKSLLEEGKAGIGMKTFQKYLLNSSETAAARLYNYFLSKDSAQEDQSDEAETGVLSKNAFSTHAFDLLNHLTDSQQLEYYIKVFSNDSEEASYNDVYELIVSCYEIEAFSMKEEEEEILSDHFLSAVSRAIMHGKNQTTSKYIFNWFCQHCPKIVSAMHRFISHALTVGYSAIPDGLSMQDSLYTQKDYQTPRLRGGPEKSSPSRHPCMIWLLTCSLSPIYTKFITGGAINAEEDLSSVKDPKKFIDRVVSLNQHPSWVSLFNSDEDGLSINRLQHHSFDYHGPTILVVTADDETMFAVANDEEWKDSKHFYGGPDAMCLKLYPEYKIIEKGPKTLYFNISSRGFPTGLHVGTDSSNRALTIDLNLQKIHYRQIPYKLQTLEIWGCGTPRDREKQLEYKKLASNDVEKRRQVKVNFEWKDHPDRCLLEMATVEPSYGRFEKATQNQSS